MVGSAAFGQVSAQTKLPAKQPADPNVRATPAYAEVLLRKTDLEAELEALLMEYTEDYPKVKDLRLELNVLKPEIERILAVKTFRNNTNRIFDGTHFGTFSFEVPDYQGKVTVRLRSGKRLKRGTKLVLKVRSGNTTRVLIAKAS